MPNFMPVFAARNFAEAIIAPEPRPRCREAQGSSQSQPAAAYQDSTGFASPLRSPARPFPMSSALRARDDNLHGDLHRCAWFRREQPPELQALSHHPKLFARSGNGGIGGDS
ncbi:MAG: hypothetical protein HC910_00655 [Spirulinaceae cyanobacterium SM2_1_0]|nr:hypothetical protein [Spirulinaceae cyanobacterium SM2_1_0]